MCGQQEMSIRTFLCSGRSLPSDGARAYRNEGVGIALNGKATGAWKNAGEIWEAVSSRLVVTRLKWVYARQRKRGGSRETCDIFIFVIRVCLCSPCKGSSKDEARFFLDLLDAVSKIPRGNVFVLLGDFKLGLEGLKVVMTCGRE